MTRFSLGGTTLRLCSILSAALLLTVWIKPGPVNAQENPAYQAAYERASASFSEGRFAECAEEFRQAFNIEPRGSLLFNIGTCYEKAADIPNAIISFQRFIEAVPTSPKRPAVQRHLGELQAQIADQYEEVSVSSNPPNATIFVDEKARGAMGSAPLSFRLLPGTYVIIAELAGHETIKKKIELSKGDPLTVDLNLVDSSNVGTVELLVTERDAEVWIDGKKVGKTPLAEPLRLKSGSHEVSVQKAGFGNWARTVNVKAGGKESLKADLAPTGGEAAGGEGGGDGSLFGGGRLLPLITAGVGLGLAAGGAVSGLSASSLHDQLDAKKKKNEPIAKQDIETGKSRVMMTNLLLGGGGAAIVGGAVWFFLAGSGGPALDPSIGLSVSPDGGAFVWGSF